MMVTDPCFILIVADLTTRTGVNEQAEGRTRRDDMVTMTGMQA